MRHLLILAVPAVLQFGFDFTDGGTGLGGLIGVIQAEIASIFAFLWAVIVALANYLIAALNFIAKFFLTLMQDIAKAFKWIWEKIIKTGLVKVLGWFIKVRDWLNRTFGPLLRFLLKVRAILDKYFNLIVKPILVMIQHVRQVLQLFRLLGVKWAVALDARLALIENRIVQVYETIRTTLNQVISDIQLVLDPSGLLRRLPVIGSLIRSSAELANLLYRTVGRPLTGDEQAAQDRARRALLPAAAKDNLVSFKAGTLPPELADARKEFLFALGVALHS
jgi:hypothetical protein